MTLQMHRESTEFVFLGVTGDLPAIAAEMAFMAAGQRPGDDDWQTAILIPSPGHQLWNDAQATGLVGDYFVAVLVGAYGGNLLVLDPGAYQVWLRLSDIVEQPVRIAPIAMEIL